MQHGTGKKHDLVLTGRNALEAAAIDLPVAHPVRIVQLQVAAFELARFAMKKVYEREMP
jgi:hypothetical protein